MRPSTEIKMKNKQRNTKLYKYVLVSLKFPDSLHINYLHIN